MYTKKINTAIASFGLSGQVFHAPFVQAHPGFNLIGIVERHKNLSRNEYQHTKLYRSFEEILKDDEVELVVVNTPVQTHFEYTKKAIESGKHVIVEKPFTVSEDEAIILTQLASERNTKSIVYQNRRYDGDFLKLKEILRSQQLGKIKEVEMRFDRYRPEKSSKQHKEAAIPGAGILHDIGAHLIDQAIILFGMPQSVFADIDILRDGGEANDYFEIILKYNDGLRVRLVSTVFALGNHFEYRFHGSQGSFLQKRSDVQEQALTHGLRPGMGKWMPDNIQFDGELFTFQNHVTHHQNTTSSQGNYMHFYNDVYEYITLNKANPIPFSDAVKTMKIIDIALKSSSNGCFIDL
ncbi:MAG: oxidoreductase [Chitinophagaceae bacterium]|nr:MAG: oxidoreductase [Chitinophagaceae bacterium]